MRKIVLVLILLAAALPAARAAHAEPWDALIRQAGERHLHAEKTWLQLLHYNDSGRRSKIFTREFFLAPDGDRSPESELNATLRAWFTPPDGNPDAHPRCRFPARYLWLSERLEFPPEPGPWTCPRLEGWAKFNRLESVSLIMVSGYFGNPASTFGHILFKLNNGEVRTLHGLLDMGINYGALIPPKEPTPVYILKGLFGGYQAGFSDKRHYTQDLVYTRTEFRDMWEYELDLPERERRLLVYHFWEILGKKFTYYFLEQNCAYRFAELMELVTGEDFLSGVHVWYAPVALFHRLREIDRARPQPLIRKVRYMPSSQRQMYAQFALLTGAERDAANRYIEHPEADGTARFAAFPPERQSEIANALLAYYEYRLAGEGEDDETEAQEREPEAEDGPRPGLLRRKGEVLRMRLALPASLQARAPEIPEMDAPSLGSRPSTVGLGAGYNNTVGTYTWAQYAAFHYDVAGRNNLGGSELTVFSLSAGFTEQSDAFLDRLDIIRVRKNNLYIGDITGESTLSWQVRGGAKRDRADCIRCQEAYASIGGGRAFGLGRAGLVYAMLDAGLESRGERYPISPNIGLVLKPGRWWSAWLHGEYEFHPETGEGLERVRAETRLSLATNFELRVLYRKGERSEARASLQFFY